jgi:hypothetical protein
MGTSDLVEGIVCAMRSFQQPGGWEQLPDDASFIIRHFTGLSFLLNRKKYVFAALPHLRNSARLWRG